MLSSWFDSPHRRRAVFAAASLLSLILFVSLTASAQEAEEAGPQAAAPGSAAAVAAPAGGSDTPAADSSKKSEINFFYLLFQGGSFMIPILGMSLLAVTMGIERAINLRRDKVIPPDLVTALGQLGASREGFDPRKAYRICQQFPSIVSTVIRSMLLKVGRPHSEVEHAVAETCQREAERAYANVRWLNLAVAVTPLIGLLGTVWGMIICFHDTAQIDTGANRAEALAEGIYIALVTTLGGLIVAIPAAVASHYFEGRIQDLMFQVEEMVFHILPQIERFEGRVRFTRHQAEGDGSPDTAEETPRPVAGAK